MGVFYFNSNLRCLLDNFYISVSCYTNYRIATHNICSRMVLSFYESLTAISCQTLFDSLYFCHNLFLFAFETYFLYNWSLSPFSHFPPDHAVDYTGVGLDDLDYFGADVFFNVIRDWGAVMPIAVHLYGGIDGLQE